MTSASAGRRRSELGRRPRNPQTTIEIEMTIHDRALAAYRNEALTEPADQLVFAYGVISSSITDPMYAYTSEQLAAVLRGLDRSRATYAEEAHR